MPPSGTIRLQTLQELQPGAAETWDCRARGLPKLGFCIEHLGIGGFEVWIPNVAHWFAEAKVTLVEPLMRIFGVLGVWCVPGLLKNPNPGDMFPLQS